MKDLIGRSLASLTNFGLTLLRNRHNLRLSREELRASRISFSLFGEDLSVLRWVSRYPHIPKIYVDAGCNDPIVNSNTLLLHKAGWRGLNIDMAPEHISAFNALRPQDINVVAALGSTAKNMKLFSYGDIPTATDRLGPSTGSALKSVENEEPINTRVITTTTLNDVLGRSPFGAISYLNIDCEGYGRQHSHADKDLDFRTLRKLRSRQRAHGPSSL